MNRMIAPLCVAALLGYFPAFGQIAALPTIDARLAVLRELKIGAATITQVERDPSGTRTIVKLVLNPAKSSNINVEVWLPDADKWNARFLGLGNGGAAGKINPDSLAGPSGAGYAVATTDMGTAPNSDSGIGNREVWKDFGFRATHLKRRRPGKGLLHHSDRGSQYVDADYVAALAAAGIERSMSRAGNCYDNAAMESFWSTLKTDTGSPPADEARLRRQQRHGLDRS